MVAMDIETSRPTFSTGVSFANWGIFPNRWGWGIFPNLSLLVKVLQKLREKKSLFCIFSQKRG
jgi:hypothetical protein